MRISVVIPAFNVERWVAGAIRSALSQEGPPDEVIVVDDGSTDDTSQVVATFPEVRLLRQANHGLAGARNAGARVASGDALFFLDADDELLPGALERLRAEALRPDWAAIVPNCLRVHDAGSMVAWATAPSRRCLGRPDLPRLIRSNWLSPHALLRASVARRFPYREGLRAAEDLDLWMRLLLASESIVVLGEPLVKVRVGRPGSLSGRTRLMRESRRSVFGSLWHRRDLTVTERMMVGAQVARTTVGIAVAPRPSQAAGPPRVVAVHLDEPGGGRTHREILRSSLGARVTFRQVALPPASPPWTAGTWLSSWKTLFSVIGENRPLVHAHGIRAAAAAAPVARVRRAPLIVTVHGLHSMRRSDSRWIRWANRRVLREAHQVLVLSDSDRGSIVADRLARTERVHVIRPAFVPATLPHRDEARSSLSIAGEGLVVLWLGRLSWEKDPLSLVKAVAGVEDRDVIALVAGDGELQRELRSEIEVRRLDDAIRLLGWVSDPGEVLAAADIFVSTSRWEGLPVAALEAAGAGLALVLTDVPGNADLMRDGVPALLVPPGSPEHLAAAIDELASDPARRLAMGSEASRIVRSRFTPEALAEDVLAAYRSVLAGR